MKTVVWTYWEGPKPEYIDICLRSVYNVCSSQIVLTPETVDEYVPPNILHPNYKLLPQIALKADCIRAALLATYGGFWFDADTVGIRDPLRLLEDYPNTTALYTTWTKPPTRILNGYLYLSSGSKTAMTWLEQINQVIASNPQDASWCSLGEKLLTKILPSQANAFCVDRSTFLPIDIDSDVPVFFQPRNFRDFITPQTVCYGLNHSWFMYHKAKEMTLPRNEWGNSPLLIHRLLHTVS